MASHGIKWNKHPGVYSRKHGTLFWHVNHNNVNLHGRLFTERQWKGQRQREGERRSERERETEIGIHADREKDSERDSDSERETDRQTDRQTHTHTQTDRETERIMSERQNFRRGSKFPKKFGSRVEIERPHILGNVVTVAIFPSRGISCDTVRDM